MAMCTHVFVRHDAVKKLLQPLYDDPCNLVSWIAMTIKGYCSHEQYFMTRVMHACNMHVHKNS